MSKIPDIYYQDDLRLWIYDLIRTKMPTEFTVSDMLKVMMEEVPLPADISSKERNEAKSRVRFALEHHIKRKLIRLKGTRPVPNHPGTQQNIYQSITTN